MDIKNPDEKREDETKEINFDELESVNKTKNPEDIIPFEELDAIEIDKPLEADVSSPEAKDAKVGESQPLQTEGSTKGDNGSAAKLPSGDEKHPQHRIEQTKTPRRRLIQRFERPKSRKKVSILSVSLIIVILGGIFGAIYYFGFYERGQVNPAKESSTVAENPLNFEKVIEEINELRFEYRKLLGEIEISPGTTQEELKTSIAKIEKGFSIIQEIHNRYNSVKNRLPEDIKKDLDGSLCELSDNEKKFKNLKVEMEKRVTEIKTRPKEMPVVTADKSDVGVDDFKPIKVIRPRGRSLLGEEPKTPEVTEAPPSPKEEVVKPKDIVEPVTPEVPGSEDVAPTKVDNTKPVEDTTPDIQEPPKQTEKPPETQEPPKPTDKPPVKPSEPTPKPDEKPPGEPKPGQTEPKPTEPKPEEDVGTLLKKADADVLKAGEIFKGMKDNLENLPSDKEKIERFLKDIDEINSLIKSAGGNYTKAKEKDKDNKHANKCLEKIEKITKYLDILKEKYKTE